MFSGKSHQLSARHEKCVSRWNMWLNTSQSSYSTINNAAKSKQMTQILWLEKWNNDEALLYSGVLKCIILCNSHIHYTQSLKEIDSNIIQMRPLCGQATYTTTLWRSRGGQSDRWTVRGKDRKTTHREKAKEEGGERVGLNVTRHYQPPSSYNSINLTTQSQRRVPCPIVVY